MLRSVFVLLQLITSLRCVFIKGSNYLIYSKNKPSLFSIFGEDTYTLKLSPIEKRGNMKSSSALNCVMFLVSVS